MAFVPTTQNVKPVVGGSADVWGGILNDRVTEIYNDFVNLAAQFNVTQTTATDAMPKAGGTFLADVILSTAGPSSQYSSGYRGVPVVSIDAARTFLLTDAGRMIRLSGATNRTWTIPPVSSVGFPVGTVIVLRAGSTGAITVARGVGVELRADGSATDANKTVPAYGKASITHEATNVWSISGVA